MSNMSLPFRVPKVDPRSPDYSRYEGNTNLQQQPCAFPQEVVMVTKNMYVDKAMSGLGEASSVMGASQIYRAADPLPAGIEQQPVIIDGLYQVQRQPLAIEAAHARIAAAAASRKIRRMIKNRESAARSRARRQAYTSQLEIEINRLKEENEKLKENLKSLHNDTSTPPQTEEKPLPSSSAKL